MNARVHDCGLGDVQVPWRWRTTGMLLLVCLTHAAVLWYLHDRFWYPTDDGFYAHLAERVLAGEVLHLDVQDIHPAYLHGLHAMTFAVLGVDMVHLRYPLMVCSLLQVVFTFVLLRVRGLLLATGGAVVAGSLGVVQFFSPNPNWYCLMLATALAWWMIARRQGSRHRLVVAGAIVGLITCLRHLSGVWAAMGLLTVILLELDRREANGGVSVGRALAALMLAGTAGYVLATPGIGPGGMLLMVAAPVSLLVSLVLSSRAANRDVLTAIVQCGTGSLLAALPLLGYYVWNGTLSSAIVDLVLRAWGETRLPFFEPLGWYVLLPLMGLLQLTSPASVVEAANGVYWIVLPAASLINGVIVLRHLHRAGDVRDVIPGVMATYFALVSVLLEGPFYLYYSASFSVVAVLWHAGTAPRVVARAAVAVAGLLAAIAITSHAGETMSRNGFEILRGQRVDHDARAALTGMRATFLLPRWEVDEYSRLISRIRERVGTTDTMLVIPNDAQLYFLAGRGNVSWFYNSALGLQDEAQFRTLMRTIANRRPSLVVYRPGDKYESMQSRRLMALVRQRYDLLTVEAGRELYVRRIDR